MKKLVFQISWCCLMVILLGACEKLEELDFSEITFRTIEPPLEAGQLTLRASILSDLLLDSVGFMYSTAVDDISGDNIGGTVVMRGQDNIVDGEFTDIIEGLSVDSLYHFRAIAIHIEEEGTRLVFSPEIRSFNFNLNILMLPEYQIMNDQAEISVLFSGLQDATFSIADRGFEIVECCSDPCEIDESCFENVVSISKGFINDDGILVDTIPDLAFNTTYLVRAWATKASSEKFYSNIIKIEVEDGWRQIASLPSNLVKAAAAANEEYGFVTLGSPNSFTDWNTVFRYEPTSNVWEVFETDPDCKLLEAVDGIAFWANDAFYAGLGGKSTFTSVFNEIKKFDFSNNCWEYIAPPDGFSRLRGAVSFVLEDGKVYIGTGTNRDYTEFYNEFWQYDPQANSWLPMAPLPVKITTPIETEDNTLGRTEAVSFVYNGEAYVGGGYAEGRGVVGDFWKFIPPDEMPPAGGWEYVGYFPGDSRYLSVAVVVNGRAYFGTGESANINTLNDWWEYIPDAPEGENKWIPRAPLPSFSRSHAVAFAVGDRAFVGSGITRITEGNDDLQELSDFWEYIPTQ